MNGVDQSVCRDLREGEMVGGLTRHKRYKDSETDKANLQDLLFILLKSIN